MDNLTSGGIDGGLETGNGSAPAIIAPVAPELDLGSHRIRGNVQFVRQPLDRALGYTIGRTPRAKRAEAAEQVEPGTEAVRGALPELVAIPQPHQFFECLRVGHGQVQPADYRLVVSNSALATRTGINFGEVRIGFELGLFVAQVIEARNAPHDVVEVVNRACDLQDERPLGGDARGVLLQGQRITVCFEHVPQTLKHGPEPLALPSRRRQLQSASAARSAGASITCRSGDLQ